jgi:Transposase DDE domain
VTTEEFIIRLFCLVDDRLGPRPKHTQARLWPSELVTIGLLCALKGGSFRSFARWLARDYTALFAGLPERTRLLRALRAHQAWTDTFLADPSFFTVIDSYGIELIHPWRAGRSRQQVGKKGRSNHRWIVGIKLCWLLNDHGEVVAWDWDTANVHDSTFAPLVERVDGQTITLADSAFHAADGDPANLKRCRRGAWNERMLVETVLSLVHRVCRLKYLWHRARPYLQMHLAYVTALFNALLALNYQLEPDETEERRWPHIAQYAL